MKQVELRKLREGQWFKRKPEAAYWYIREHYNRADQFGPATFWCSTEWSASDGREFKPNVLVWVD